MDEERAPSRGWQEDREPLTAPDEQTTSKYADAKTQDLDEHADLYDFGEPGSIDTGLAIATTVDDYLKTGLFNSDFRLGPPYPDKPIDNETNPLPFWQLGQFAEGTATYNKITAWRAYWVDSTVSRSGKAVRMYFDEDPDVGAFDPSATAGIYQVVPFTGNEMWGHCHANVSAASGTPSTLDYFSLNVTQLDASGSALLDSGYTPQDWYVASDDIPWPGWAGYSGEYALGFDYQSRHLGCFDLTDGSGSGAYQKTKYVRVWIGAEATDVSGFGGYYRDVHNVTMRKPSIRWATIPVVNNNWNASAVKALYVPADGDWTTQSFPVAHHIIQGGGVNLGVSTRLKAGRTSGTLETYLWSNSGATGPSAHINSGTTNNAYGTYTLGYWAQLTDWDEGAWERVRGEHSTSSFAPTTNENLTHLTFALFDRPNNSGL